MLDELDERYAELRLSRPAVVGVLRRSLERDGLLRPLLLNLEQSGKLALVDGFKRVRALRELGHESALAWVVHLDDTGVRTAMLAHNTPHRGLCELEEAWVIRSLVRGCQLQQRKVAELLGRHRSWVCRRLMLAERLDESVQQDIRLGLINPTVARELGRLPRGNQARVALNARKHGLSSRHCATLVERALRCHDERQLEALLRDPWRYGVADGEPAQPPPDRGLGQAAEQLRQQLVRMGHAAGSLCESCGQPPLSAVSKAELLVLGAVIPDVRARCSQALQQLDELLQLSKGA